MNDKEVDKRIKEGKLVLLYVVGLVFCGIGLVIGTAFIYLGYLIGG